MTGKKPSLGYILFIGMRRKNIEKIIKIIRKNTVL